MPEHRTDQRKDYERGVDTAPGVDKNIQQDDFTQRMLREKGDDIARGGWQRLLAMPKGNSLRGRYDEGGDSKRETIEDWDTDVWQERTGSGESAEYHSYYRRKVTIDETERYYKRSGGMLLSPVEDCKVFENKLEIKKQDNTDYELSRKEKEQSQWCNSHKPGSADAGDEHDPKSDKFKKGRYLLQGDVTKPASDIPELDEIVKLDDLGSMVESVKGTLNAPILRNDLVQNCIFINHKPYQEDIRQGNVGDCYFLAALLQVVHYDPHRIVEMMQVVGDTIYTTFYRKEGFLFKSWKPVTIKTKIGVIERDGERMGSDVRLALKPKEAVWNANVVGTTLQITKKQLFETALWVNCLEEAFALFAGRYGKYGDGLNHDEHKKEHFNAIESGVSGRCLHLFYGDMASDSQSIRTADPELEQDMNDCRGLVEANKPLVKELIKLAKSQNKQSEEDVYMSVQCSAEYASERLRIHTKNTITLLEQSIDAEGNPNRKSELLNAKSNLEAILTATDNYYDNGVWKNVPKNDPAKDSQIKKIVDYIFAKLFNNQVFRELNLATFQTLKEAVGTICQRRDYISDKDKDEDEDEDEKGNLFLYTHHIYNLHKVYFCNSENRMINGESESTILKDVDVRLSTAIVQNPHASAKPNYREDEKRKGDGTFKMSLESLLRIGENFTSTTVKNSRHDFNNS